MESIKQMPRVTRAAFFFSRVTVYKKKERRRGSGPVKADRARIRHAARARPAQKEKERREIDA